MDALRTPRLRATSSPGRALSLFGLRLFFCRSLGGDEFQRDAIDAVALVGGGVEAFALEDVAEVAVALRAEHFGADHAAGEVVAGDHVLRFGRIVEGRPAAVAVEFLLRGEELGVAAAAVVGAFALGFELLVNLAVRSLGAGLAEDAVLLGREELLPFLVGLLDFGGGLGWWGRDGFHGVLSFLLGGTGAQREGGSEQQGDSHGE